MKRIIIGVVVGLLIGGIPVLAAQGGPKLAECRKAANLVLPAVDNAEFSQGFHVQLRDTLRVPAGRSQARQMLRVVIEFEETDEGDVAALRAAAEACLEG